MLCLCVGVSVCNVRTCRNNLESFNVGEMCSEEMGFPITYPSEAVFIVCLSSTELFSSCYSRVRTFLLRNEAGLNTQIFTKLMLMFEHVATPDSRLYGGVDEDSIPSGMWVCVIGRG